MSLLRVCVVLFSLEVVQDAVAHRSLPAGVTCFNQFNSSADALLIPDAGISWASYRMVTCGAPVFWLKTETTKPNQNLSFTALQNVIARFESVRINVVVIGPGLPALGPALDNSSVPVPAEVNSDIGDGEGAVMFESPADQSSCNHLESIPMGMSSDVRDARCHFHEPFGNSHSWVLLDRTIMAPTVGMYRFAIFIAGSSTAKIAFACCDWPEDFTTQWPMPEADCPVCGTKSRFNGYSALFHEKPSMVNYSGFPAFQDCNADADATPQQPLPEEVRCPDESASAAGGGGPGSQDESCALGCTGEQCHSHNIFGACEHTLRWVTPKPQLYESNVTELILFKGDKIFFTAAGHIWPHNLIKMHDQQHLDRCNWTGSSEVMSIGDLAVGKTLTFDEAGTFYYSCAITGHCAIGQKLTVMVKDASSGMQCHDHGGGPAATSTSGQTASCPEGELSAYVVGNADYGAAENQCTELCTSRMTLGFMAASGVMEGTCAEQGYPGMVEEKSVRPGGPLSMGVVVKIMDDSSPSSCHCHSYEEILCSSEGNALYDEHIVEIEQHCQKIIDGEEDVCPYKCFQPFEVLHLHYLECDLREKDVMFLAIKQTKQCHIAAPAPFDAECTMIHSSGGSSSGDGGDTGTMDSGCKPHCNDTSAIDSGSYRIGVVGLEILIVACLSLIFV